MVSAPQRADAPVSRPACDDQRAPEGEQDDRRLPMESGSQPGTPATGDAGPKPDRALRRADGMVTPPARERPPVPPREGADASSGGTPPTRPRIPRWAQWAIYLGILLMWNIILFAPIAPPAAAAIPYSELVAQAKAGNVASVEFTGQAAAGSFVHAVTWPPATSPSGAPAPSAATAPASYSTFTTVVPPDGDPALLPLLEQHGVVVSAKDPTAMGSLLGTILGLVGTFLPIALLVGFFIYTGRQVQRNQQGLLGVGRSNARLYNEERPGVTFEDVAGEDEAKNDLTEVVDFLNNPER
jgi:cell division protease FtsH